MNECQICEEVFSQTNKPRSLPCGHSICQSCLSQLPTIMSEVQCPGGCGRTFAIPSSGFPVNYQVLRAAESLDLAACQASPAVPPTPGSSEPKCSNCKHATATLYCESCARGRGDLCGDCSTTIHCIPLFADHAVCSITMKALRMCADHKDEAAVLFCMQCERLACIRCSFGTHRMHSLMDVDQAAPEKRALILQRFGYVRPNIVKLVSRLEKIGEEQKLTDHECLAITAHIKAAAEQLHKAVANREQELEQAVASLSSRKANNLALLQEQHGVSLSTLTKLDEDLKSLEKLDGLSLLHECKSWESAERLVGQEVDGSSISQGRLVFVHEADVLAQTIARWGTIQECFAVQGTDDQLPSAVLEHKAHGAVEMKVERLPVSNVTYYNGRVSWDAMNGASKYEVQMVCSKKKDAKYQKVWKGKETSWVFSVWKIGGKPRVRVRAFYPTYVAGSWGPFSDVLSLPLIPDHVSVKTADISLISDSTGLLRVARHKGPSEGWESVRGSVAWSPPPSASASSNIASFQVIVDSMASDVFVGVCSVLPVSGFVLGGKSSGGISYDSSGLVYKSGVIASDLASYGIGDVIRVQLDYLAKTLSFFKNGVLIGQPIADVDVSQPLYAAVSLAHPGDQVTLL